MNLLIASVLGGIFVSDATAFGQFMFSRPIFCGPVIGLITGDVRTGLYVGMIMELLWISVVPLGSEVPPDSSVVSTSAAYIGAGSGGDRGFVVFLILALVPLGILFKRVDMLHREFNVYFAHKTEEKLTEGDVSYVGRAAVYGFLLFFLKGTLFLAAVMGAGAIIFPAAYELFPGWIKGALGEVFYVLPAIGLGTAVTAFMFKRSKSSRR